MGKAEDRLHTKAITGCAGPWDGRDRWELSPKPGPRKGGAGAAAGVGGGMRYILSLGVGALRAGGMWGSTQDGELRASE